MIKHVFTLVVLALGCAVVVAQPQLDDAVKSLGKNVTVKSVTARYDFSKLPRDIELPFSRFPFGPNEQPSGYTPSDKVKPATPVATKLLQDWKKVLPAFDKPAEVIVQSYQGKEGGVIAFVRWSKPLPSNARAQICKVLYKADEKTPGSDTKDDLLVSDSWCILWSFANPISELKQAHQKRTFAIVNEEARKWIDAHPEKMKTLRQNKP